LIRAHPGVVSFVTGVFLAALYLVARPTGPNLLLSALQLLSDAVPIGVGLLLLGWLLSRRGVTWADSLLAVSGVWVGFIAGFYALGLLSCAFCLS
jgi:hypothetical protein